jgi:hypothetical protein
MAAAAARRRRPSFIDATSPSAFGRLHRRQTSSEAADHRITNAIASSLRPFRAFRRGRESGHHAAGAGPRASPGRLQLDKRPVDHREDAG